MKNITLYDHQREIVEKNPERLGLFHDMGTGKTITLLALANANNVQALIVCPKALKAQWLTYVIDWTTPETRHTVITKEEFKKLFLAKELPAYEAVIIDEGHHFSGMKSALYKCMRKYLTQNNVRFRWIATGTPYRSSAMNIYALATLLGHEWNFYSFQQKFFTMVRMGARLVPKQKTTKQAEEDLAALVNEIGVTLKIEDIADIPEQFDHLELFELTDEQRTAIKELTDPMAITRFTKSHCIENGLLYSDGYSETQSFKSLKVDRLLEIVRDTPRVAVVCRYTEQLSYLSKLLSEKGYTTHIISGQTKDRAQIIQSLNENTDPEARYVVLIQAACSEGYELKHVDTMVFMSLSFSHSDHIQIRRRILRINNLRENTYYYLMSKGIDKAVYDSIIKKLDFHEALFIKEHFE